MTDDVVETWVLVVRCQECGGYVGPKDERCRECAVTDEYDRLTRRQSALLTGVVNALKGPPPELTWWSHHDAPQLAQAERAARLSCQELAGKLLAAVLTATHDEGCHPSEGRHSEKCDQREAAIAEAKLALLGEPPPLSGAFYRQARLRRGTVEHVAWLPEFLLPEFLAHVGTAVRVKATKETWEVVEVYRRVRISTDYLAEYELDHKRQREASDI